jgi:hypothetical protein
MIKTMGSVEPDQVLDRQNAPGDADSPTTLVQLLKVDREKAKTFDQAGHLRLGGRVRSRDEQHAPATGCARIFGQEPCGQVVEGLHDAGPRHIIGEHFGR